MTALLIGMQRSGFALQAAPRLRFCVCFAGIRPRDPKIEGCYAAMRDCSSLHIIGDRDPVKQVGASQAGILCCISRCPVVPLSAGLAMLSAVDDAFDRIF